MANYVIALSIIVSAAVTARDVQLLPHTAGLRRSMTKRELPSGYLLRPRTPLRERRTL
jgi:hypothetical protein